jgi:hypothetical protein
MLSIAAVMLPAKLRKKIRRSVSQMPTIRD